MTFPSTFCEKSSVLGAQEMLSHLILANAFGRVGDDGHMILIAMVNISSVFTLDQSQLHV